MPFHRILGASAIGPLHLINVTPCQDAFAYDALLSGYAFIAIADGLGSAFLSDFGAKSAVDAAVFTAKEMVVSNKEDFELNLIVKKAVFSARKSLLEKAKEYQCNLRDLACTLIVVAMYMDSVAVAHIGDGAVVAKIKNGLKLISGPEDSEYVNEVSPLTGENWEKSLRITPTITNILGIMTFTDGLQRAALRKTSDGLIPFEGFCEPLFSYVTEIENIKEGEEDIKRLLSSKKVCINSEDDKTLVIGCIREKGVQ